MELTGEITTKEEEDEALQDDLFFALLNGKTVSEEVESTRGKFTIKFPKQKDLLLIDRRVASMRAGLDARAFDETGNFNLQKIAFLDVVVQKGPKWYENIKDKNENFSWGSMPDSDFTDEVYVKAYQFRVKVQEKLKGNAGKANREASKKSKAMDEAVGDGVFSGVAMQSKKS